MAAMASPGTTIHTAVSNETDWDEIYLYANNTSSAAVTLTLEWGGTTNPDDTSPVILPANGGKILVVAGEILQNSLTLAAFASTANVVVVSGYVNRIAAA